VRPSTKKRRALGLAHETFPGDHRLVVHLAQLGRRRDRERAEKMRDIAPVGAPGAGALLALEPDFFLGDGAASAATVEGSRSGVRRVGRLAGGVEGPLCARDKLDYHVHNGPQAGTGAGQQNAGNVSPKSNTRSRSHHPAAYLSKASGSLPRMTKKPKNRNRPSKAVAGDCVIPPAIPVDALSGLVFERDEKSAEEIAAYVERQSPGETVKHAEIVMTQRVLGRKYECWDVRTNKSRLWVITSPTNLYDQKLFPSLDYTLSFHIGLMARVMARHEPKAGAAAWRRWEQAGQALDEAEEPEDFQSVGMRCRECLVAMVRTLALPEMVPANSVPPKRADVVGWCDLIADHVAHGPSADHVRRYLKAISKAGWSLVNWLTHAHGATLADGLIAHELTQHILVLFGTAVLRYRQGVPDRCEACGSYQFELWADEPGAPMKPRCRSCGWTKDDDALSATAGGQGRAKA
jgi:hypothetical protein